MRWTDSDANAVKSHLRTTTMEEEDIKIGRSYITKANNENIGTVTR